MEDNPPTLDPSTSQDSPVDLPSQVDQTSNDHQPQDYRQTPSDHQTQTPPPDTAPSQKNQSETTGSPATVDSPQPTDDQTDVSNSSPDAGDPNPNLPDDSPPSPPSGDPSQSEPSRSREDDQGQSEPTSFVPADGEDKSVEKEGDDRATPSQPNGGGGAKAAEALLSAETKEKKKDRGGSRRFIYILSGLTTIGGFLFGYDIGIVAGSMLFIRPYFELSTFWQEAIVSGTVAAAAVAALLAGWLCDRFGRKMTIMTSGVVFTAGGIMMGSAPTKEVLLVGRVVSGIGVGLASVVVPVYVAEASPVEIRGRLVSMHQMLINTGIVVSSLLAGGLSYVEPDGWRYMLGLAAVPGVLQFIGFIFMPESPRWLVGQGRKERAEEVLMRMRGGSDVTEELQDIVTTVESEQKESVEGLQHLIKVLTTPHVRRALFVGCALLFFQQWCGINTVIYYSGTVLKMAGFPVKYAIWLVTVPNLINFLAMFIGMYFVERSGRRPLLIASLAGTIVGLIILAVGFQLSSQNAAGLNTTIVEVYDNGTVIQECIAKHLSCDSCVKDIQCGYCFSSDTTGSCLPAYDEERSSAGRCVQSSSTSLATKWAYEFCPSDYTWLVLLGMAVFVFAFAPGLGPMPWTINSEIYPLWARSTCNSISACVAWVSNLGISFTFLTMTENITIHGTFWLFTALTVVGVIFMVFMLPETRNKTLEEVEQLFMTPQQREALAQQQAEQGHTKADT